MFDFQKPTVDLLCDHIQDSYTQTYGLLAPHCPQIATWAARSVCDIIGRTTALYHNTEHTVMVTSVGLEVLRGRHIREGGTTPDDWLQFVVSLLCHDIGYVAGACRADGRDGYDRGDGTLVQLPEGHTDAALAPYHINRGQQFIRQRFAGHDLLDVDRICANIERTRFPVPKDDDHAGTSDYPGLVRAADLIGQLSDPTYPNKQVALFYEFQEIGINDRLSYTSPADLRRDYPKFFWKVVFPYVGPALGYLSLTSRGRQYLKNLYAHVFTAEHDLRW